MFEGINQFWNILNSMPKTPDHKIILIMAMLVLLIATNSRDEADGMVPLVQAINPTEPSQNLDKNLASKPDKKSKNKINIDFDDDYDW